MYRMERRIIGFELPEKVRLIFKLQMAMLVCCIFAGNIMITAGASGRLQDVMYTNAFSGVLGSLMSAAWLWAAVQWIITWSCGLGLAMTTINFFLVLTYKTCQNVFDKVHVIKMEKMKGAFFGIPAAFKSMFDYQGDIGIGGGFDVIIAFFLSLIPNVKEFVMGINVGDGKASKLVTEDETVFATFLNMAKYFSVSIIILCFGFNGVFMKALAMGVDGLNVVADKALENDIKPIVAKKLATIGNYTFVIDGAGTEASKMAKTVCLELYQNIVSRAEGSVTKDRLNILGQTIENAVYGNSSVDFVPASGIASMTSFLGGDLKGYDNLTMLANAGIPDSMENRKVQKEEDVRDLKLEVKVTSIPIPFEETGISYSLKDIAERAGFTCSSNLYLHVYVNWTSNTTANFQILEGKDKNTVEGIQVD